MHAFTLEHVPWIADNVIVFSPKPARILALLTLCAHTLMEAQSAPTSTEAVRFEVTATTLEIIIRGDGRDRPGHAVFVALDTDPLSGSAVLPYERNAEGSTVFLPIRADRIYSAILRESGPVKSVRLHRQTMWSSHLDVKPEFDVQVASGEWRISIPLAELHAPQRVGVVVYEKNIAANDGWGRLLSNARFGAKGGGGDQYISRYAEIDITRTGAVGWKPRMRLQPHGERARIYQLLPRVFGNTNETRKPNGTIAENGSGKFSDINDAAIASLKQLGITHVWLTGVLQQATSTDYSAIGEPADDPDLLKGLAGSPYAIRDYFDLCPDYADHPAERLAEFKALIARLHSAGLLAIIDFVPNHVARSHQSSVMPDLSFGAKDDRAKFFDAQNNFFWLQHDTPGGGPPLRLPTVENGRFISPTCAVLGKGDGLFDGERDCGRVTGNNVANWSPTTNDWYETVKLNYGFDFTTGRRAYPHGEQRDSAIPDTWIKMDRILAYWQEQGVDGFRCDMAHMVPPEFWAWAIARARVRQPEVFFAGEAYDNDPAKVPGGDPLLAALNDHKGNVMFDLLAAGFNAVYDDPSYKKLKSIYDGGGWANDLDHVLGADFIFQNSLRYAENHDEVRLAGKGQWGGVGAEVGRPVAGILYGLSCGPALLYSGQEVGEPADGVEGFGGDDARTTIFDYWSMPELAKWVNGHRYDGGRLSPPQRDLRSFYAKLITLTGQPAFRDGEFFALNPSNNGNDRFGRLAGETASGHWLYAYLRSDASTGQHFLVVANLHRSETLRDVEIRLPQDAIGLLGIPRDARLELTEKLSRPDAKPFTPDDQTRIPIGDIPPLTPLYFELQFSKP